MDCYWATIQTCNQWAVTKQQYRPVINAQGGNVVMRFFRWILLMATKSFSKLCIWHIVIVLAHCHCFGTLSLFSLDFIFLSLYCYNWVFSMQVVVCAAEHSCMIGTILSNTTVMGSLLRQQSSCLTSCSRFQNRAAQLMAIDHVWPMTRFYRLH